MRVLGIGSTLLQHIGVVDRIEPDFPLEFQQFSTQGAGTSATALVVLARFGIDTKFVGKVADDARGHQIRDTLTGEGVDASNLILEADLVSPLQITVVESSTARRKMFFTRGNTTDITLDELPDDILDGVELLVCDGSHIAAELTLMGKAHERGIHVVTDASKDHPQIHEAVALTDTLIASERFASQFTGVGELKGMCETILERGPSNVVVTLGDEGAAGMDQSRELIRVSALDAEKIDASGAGDVYLGAYCFGILKEWSFQKKVEFANTVAGRSCTGLGSRSAIPELSEI